MKSVPFLVLEIPFLGRPQGGFADRTKNADVSKIYADNA